MTKKRKILIGLIILDVIIIGLAVYLTINLININNEEKNPKNEIENKIENNTVENNVINNSVKNTVKENKTNTKEHENEPIADPEQEIDKNTWQQQQNNEEKAINIAKEAWGEDNNVEFTFDHIDENGKYIVFVRDIETTRQIDLYTIDVETGKVIQ